MSETNERGNPDERRADGRSRGSPQSRQGTPHADDRGPGDQFARAATRWLLALTGLLVVLFGIGQAFGVPLLSWVGEALTSRTGQWLLVAFVGVLMIFAAANLDWR